MNKSIVRCRCGHQVLSKEVLRTDLYERRAPGDASRDYIYVKYRCRRCKRMGETFVAENIWDWAMLEASANEMSEQERDRFLDEEVVSPEDILDFHRELETFSLSDLKAMTTEPDVAPPVSSDEIAPSEPSTAETLNETPEASLEAEAKSENAKGDGKTENGKVEKPTARAPRPPEEPRNETSSETRSNHT